MIDTFEHWGFVERFAQAHVPINLDVVSIAGSPTLCLPTAPRADENGEFGGGRCRPPKSTIRGVIGAKTRPLSSGRATPLLSHHH